MLVRLRVEKQVYDVNTTLLRCDHILELTARTLAACATAQKMQLDSGKPLFCSAPELIVRSKGLMVSVIHEHTGEVLRKRRKISCRGTCRYFTHV